MKTIFAPRLWAALPPLILIFGMTTPSSASEESFPLEPPYPGSYEPGFEDAQDQKEIDVPTVSTPTTQGAGALKPISRGFSLRGGAFRPNDISNERTGLTFEEMYGDQPGPIIFIDYDFHLARSVGRLNFKLGTGLYVSKPGRGRFISEAPSNQDLETEEKFTYVVFPNTATFQYKFQYSRTQWIAPYVEGGAGYFTFMELRDDRFDPKLGGAAVTVAGAGVQFLLDNLDRRSMAHLRRDHEIQHVWFVVDFKTFLGLQNKFDFTSAVINGGFHLEF